VRVSSLTIGHASIPGVAFAIAGIQEQIFTGASSPDAILGYDVLRRFTFSIDYEHAAIYYRPQANFAAYVPLRSSGLTPKRLSNGDLVVASVRIAGDAWVAGIARAPALSASTEYQHGRARTVTVRLRDEVPRCIGQRDTYSASLKRENSARRVTNPGALSRSRVDRASASFTPIFGRSPATI
jgi:hypothetical protein